MTKKQPDAVHSSGLIIRISFVIRHSDFVIRFPDALLQQALPRFSPRWGRLRMLAYYRSCGQSGDYPEGQIYQQQVEREHWPSLPKPEKPRAAHRQKD